MLLCSCFVECVIAEWDFLAPNFLGSIFWRLAFLAPNVLAPKSAVTFRDKVIYALF